MSTATLAPLPTVTLGRTGIPVSRLGLGGLFVSSHGAARDAGIAAIRRGLELGITLIDTAPGYADSEAVVGEALVGQHAPVVLSTKLGGRPQPFFARDAASLRASLDESRRLLGREVIDLLLIHEPDRPRQYDWWEDPLTARGPVMDVLAEARARGIVRAIGLGGTTVTELARLVDTGLFDVVLTAFHYDLLWREAARDLLPAAARHGVAVIAGSPLHQGLFARPQPEVLAHPPWWLAPARAAQFAALYQLCADLAMPLSELALRFVLSEPRIHTVLTGARSVAEVEANVAAARRGPLPAEVLVALTAIADRLPCAPYGEPLFPPFGRAWPGLGEAG